MLCEHFWKGLKMGFDKFGIKNFVSETKAEEFVSLLEKGLVSTTQCLQCGHILFPPKMDCPRCGSSSVKWVELEGSGTLEAFTRVFYGPAGFENRVPYSLGVVRFHDDVRVFGQIAADIPVDEIHVGMTLKVRSIRLDSDKLSYVFEKTFQQ